MRSYWRLPLDSKSKNTEANEPVRICMGNGSEWVPYGYWERKDGKVLKSKLIGLVPDALDEVFKNTSFGYEISYMPWKRVMRNMRSNPEVCEIAPSVSYKPERPEFVYYTFPFYKVSIGYFYSNKYSESEPNQHLLSDNEACGILGYSWININWHKKHAL